MIFIMVALGITHALAVVDIRGVRGVQMHPTLAVSDVFLRTYLRGGVHQLILQQ